MITVFLLSVDIQLDEPLWKVLLSPSDVAIEVLTLCSQLEPLCKRKYTVSIKAKDDVFEDVHILITHFEYQER